MNSDVANVFRGGPPWCLSDVLLPADLRVVLLGPHPDDFDAVGVTMRFVRDNGNPLHVAVLSASNGVEDSYCLIPSREAKAAIREGEQRRSCRFFGLPEQCLAFLSLDEDETEQPADSPDNAERVRAYLAEQQPDIVVLPHGNDTNAGHQRTYAMLRAYAPSVPRPFAALLIRDPKTIASRLDVYTAFGEEEAAWKRRLLRYHDSQQQRNLNTRGHGFDDRILNVNRAIGEELGLNAPYAEGFELELW